MTESASSDLTLSSRHKNFEQNILKHTFTSASRGKRSINVRNHASLNFATNFDLCLPLFPNRKTFLYLLDDVFILTPT